MQPTPQKIRRQRRKFAITAVFCVAVAVSMVSVLVCSWLWAAFVGR